MESDRIENRDCLAGMRDLPENSVDAVVCDPPYFLVNGSGSGFMGKDWDSIELGKIWDIVCKSREFARNVGNTLQCLQVECTMGEGSIVPEIVSTLQQEKITSKSLSNAPIVGNHLKGTPVPSKASTSSVQGIVLTRGAVSALLKESFKNPTTARENPQENALFAVPISYIQSLLKNTVPESVLKLPTEITCLEREILVSSTDERRIRDVIGATIGRSDAERCTNEINIPAESVGKNVEEKRYKLITSSHIECPSITRYLIWLLYVFDATRRLTCTDRNFHASITGDLIYQFHVAWACEALRVAKPGAHLLAFGGTRTHHRLMVAIEDAGWELRDCLMWVFGSGMPKGLDVGKAIDRAAGAEREVVGERSNVFNRPITRGWDKSKGLKDKGPFETSSGKVVVVTAPATDAAKQWDGWGTALKPSYEPVVLARKPLDGTVAGTVLKWGCGGINIDGCRIGTSRPPTNPNPNKFKKWKELDGCQRSPSNNPDLDTSKGRWPANLLIDEVAADLLDLQSGTLKSGGNPARRGSAKFQTCYGEFKGQETCTPMRGANSGGASRFFYCSKASKKERSGSLHPTVKPLDLMRYLCRLVTPPGGLILDPFLGSGTTAVAAVHEGFHYLGFEINPTYCADAERRIAEARREIAAPRPNKRGNSASKDAPQATTLAAFGTEET